MSAPAFGSIGTLFGSTTSTPAFAVPASVASGDIIVVAFYSDLSDTTITGFPSGFAEAENSPRTVDAGGSFPYALHVAWKRATGNDTGTYSFTLSASVYVQGNAVRYTGCVAAGNPWDSPTAAGDGGGSNSTTTPDISVTTAGPDRMLFFLGGDSNGDGGTWSAPSGFSERQGGSSVSVVEISDLVQATQGSSGSRHATNTATGRVGDWMGALIGTTASIPPPAPRVAQPRDAGGAWWLQRDRRDANTVSTAANPLPSPLDSAWQAGAGYWHLYGDTADATPRTWQSLQRQYVSDPSLLAPAADVTPALQRVVQVRDPGEVQWLQGARRDPLLLTTALLEDALLGGAETITRVTSPVTNAPRWWMPEQPRRDAYTPGLLDSALLENELLGGADTAKRYLEPATHAPRWWMPQQPTRQGYTPGLLDSAELEGALLAGDLRRHNFAAVYVDRREVPQQRPYISDPSFYPLVPPTDPLTVAWGAGGTLWHLYNHAAVAIDRREMPQQRAYVSDPSLLATALLEDALLGGATTIQRLTWFTDRREVPQQRAYFDPTLLATALLEGALLAGARETNLAAYVDRRLTVPQRQATDPSLLAGVDVDPTTLAAGVGGDLWRRYNTPAYGDRREVPAQPPRRTLYFDAGPGLPPLTLAWGAGGNLWHLYNPRRAARSWWPQGGVFAIQCSCTTPRPPTGTTGRGSSGITIRPFTGITEDPCC